MPTADSSFDQLSIPPGVPTLLRDLVHEHLGIFFEADRFDALLDKLRERVVARGLSSFLDYYYLLKYEDESGDEWRHVMNAFSVQETYFWREVGQIRTLVDHVVPAWFRAHPTRTLRIWSAACATGEEPYSLAIALQEAGWGNHPIQIEASDASSAALERARTAVYRERSFRTLPAELREKYFDAPSGEGSRLRVDQLRPVSFQPANLVVREEVATLATAHVIFCRNVFIYFSADSIRRTVMHLARAMPAGGHLFVGASETLLKLTGAFDLEEIHDAYVYVRNSQPA